MLLLPTWCIVPAEIWKLQVAFLARRTRVITFDPRGNGASDRPEESSAYARAQQTQDALDVLDATGTERAVVVALSMGNLHALDLASDHPDRVAAWVAIAPAIRDLAPFPPERQASFDRWGEDTGRRRGLGPLQPVLLAARLSRVPRLLLRPAGARGALDQADRGPRGMGPWHHRRDPGPGGGADAFAGARSVEDQCADVRCPVVVVHGTDDRVIPLRAGARLAELTGGTLVTFEGSGHAPQGRDPVAVNRLLDRVLSASSGTSTFRPSRGRPVARSRGAGG